jgi:hypothetical protein
MDVQLRDRVNAGGYWDVKFGAEYLGFSAKRVIFGAAM